MPALLGAVTVATGLSACGSGGGTEGHGQQVVEVAGWTRIASTKSYLVIANVLPGERMYTAEEMAAEHPTVGEMVIEGPAEPLGSDVRHVEAHIYDRTTGKPLSNLSPVIVLLNRTTGAHTDIVPTLMQDVNIGPLDIHYGNNVVVPGGSDLSLSIVVGAEEVSVDGHLD
jgi:hypothetical protein